MKSIVYKNRPCPVLKEEPDTFLIFFKDEQKWIFECSQGYGEIEKDEYGIYYSFNGKLHRENGPAIERYIGEKKWYQNGKLHRLDGPAVEYSDGTKYWHQNGQLHREEGPACEWNNGDKEWWINGEFISTNNFLFKIITFLRRHKNILKKKNENYNL